MIKTNFLVFSVKDIKLNFYKICYIFFFAFNNSEISKLLKINLNKIFIFYLNLFLTILIFFAFINFLIFNKILFSFELLKIFENFMFSLNLSISKLTEILYMYYKYIMHEFLHYTINLSTKLKKIDNLNFINNSNELKTMLREDGRPPFRKLRREYPQVEEEAYGYREYRRRREIKRAEEDAKEKLAEAEKKQKMKEEYLKNRERLNKVAAERKSHGRHEHVRNKVYAHQTGIRGIFSDDKYEDLYPPKKNNNGEELPYFYKRKSFWISAIKWTAKWSTITTVSFISLCFVIGTYFPPAS